MEKQHRHPAWRHGHAAWTSTMDIIHGHAAWRHRHLQGHAASMWNMDMQRKCSMACIMNMKNENLHGYIDMQHVHSMDLQYGDMDTHHLHLHAVWTFTCSMDMTAQYRHGHSAQTWTHSTDMDFPHEHGHAAWTCTLGCSDFHFFSQSYQVSPIPAFLKTLVFRKYKKKIVTFAILAKFFFYFLKICIFSELFKINFLSPF